MMKFAEFLKLDSKQRRKVIAAVRKHAKSHGVNYLLGVDSDPKTAKSNKAGRGYYTAIQYLSPASLSGRNVCVFASKGCIKACLNTAGNPVYAKGKAKARLARTNYYFSFRDYYKILLYAELKSFVEKCGRNDLKACVRLNGTSDIRWERVFPELFECFPNVQFYDYTKDPNRRNRPANYDLTFSLSEDNAFNAGTMIAAGYRIAVVFKKKLPADWYGYKVIDADKHDMRFLDEGSIAGLKAKGDARKDDSGFVQCGEKKTDNLVQLTTLAA